MGARQPLGPTAKAILASLGKLRYSGQGNGSCWCEVAIGNPMLRDHTADCKEAQMVWAAAAKAGWVEP